MAISNEIIVIMGAILFLYLAVHKISKLFANLGFIVCGLGLMSYDSSNLLIVTGGFIIMGAGIGLMVNDLVKRGK